jgi:hypothetical protein
MKDGGFPPPANLDPTVASPAEIESESRFQEIMTSRFTSDFRQAATAFHEPLPAAVAELRPDLEVSQPADIDIKRYTRSGRPTRPGRCVG